MMQFAKKIDGDRSRSLRGYLVGLLCLTTLISFSIIAVVSLALRVPRIEQDGRNLVTRESRNAALRQDLMLKSIEDRINILAQALLNLTPRDSVRLLDQTVGNGDTFIALYLLSRNGKVMSIGSSPALRNRKEELLGIDLSKTPLIYNILFRQQTLWEEHQISALTGENAISIASPLIDGRVIMAEISPKVLLQFQFMDLNVRHQNQRENLDIWLLDSNGRILASTVGNDFHQSASAFAQTDLFQRYKQGLELPQKMEFEGQSFLVSLTKSDYINWVVIARAPTGLDNPRVMAWVWLLIGGCVGTLLIGLILSPWWARHLTQEIHNLLEQAYLTTQGRGHLVWPTGRVIELNQLSRDLATMATKLTERQRQFQAIFELSPVPLAVYDYERDILVDLNNASCEKFGLRREEWIGRSSADLPIWSGRAGREYIDQRLLDGQTIEARLRHSDGHLLICLITVRVLDRQGETWQVWALQDVTQARILERKQRTLNEELEQRVAERTKELKKANEEASLALDRMHETRDYLVQSEKMAALGGLVAGVAHELNTPLGNSLMAISTLIDETLLFKKALNQNLRKSTLDAWIDCVEQASAICSRNLSRASDLVTSFKQVAVDQSSAQRRRFTLDELIDEIILTLKPSYSRLPIRFEVEVETGVVIDSYPGHLGQILTNLISNAIVHGFEDGRSGIIRVIGRELPENWATLQVIDNGKGIAVELIGRVFDPFVTTRMGRGGTGLGLNIAYNAATHILGGSIKVESEIGKGSTFSVTIPRTAPERGEVSSDDVQTWV